MKTSLFFLLTLVATASFAQSPIQLPDSLQKRFDRLEQAHINLEKTIKESGKDINVSAGLLGIGAVAMIGGSILVATIPGRTKTDARGTHTVLSTGQIAGIGVGFGGLVMSIVGVAKLGIAGKKMKHLNSDL